VLKKVIIRLKDRYDIILMDTASGLNKYSLSAMRVADEVLWVTTPDEPSIADVRRLKIMADRFDTKTRGVIVNRIPKFSFLEIKGLPIIRKSEVEQRLGTKVVGAIPEDKDIYKAALVQKPLLEYKPKGSAAKAFRLCARNLLLQK
jgi:septum site-determining protein MinD